MIEHLNYINNLYSELELKDDLEELDYKKLNDTSLLDADRVVLQKELWLLSDYAIHIDNVNGKDEIVDYSNKRLKSTSNIYLLARYNHVLYNLTKNTIFCKSAINNYMLILEQNIDREINGYNIHLVLDWILKLSKRIKLKIPFLIEKIHAYLLNKEVSDSVKIWILDSLKHNCKVSVLNSFDFIPQLCLDIYSRDSEYGRCKHILEIGEFFADRLQPHLLSVIYEEQGNNEEKAVYNYDGRPENMIIPHYNQSTYKRMMQFYLKAGNAEKLRYATAKYNENKVGMRYLKIEESRSLPKELVEYINQLFVSANKSQPKAILHFLSQHNDLFYMSHSLIEKKWKATEENKPFYMQHFNAVRCDINNNVRSVSHEEVYKFQAYNIHLSNSIKWTIHILSSAIDSKKLTYSVFRRVLLKESDFGRELVTIRNDQKYTYCWFDKVDFAFKEFFKQYQNELKDKHSDWRSVINSLTIQFEGILRENIKLHNGESSKIVGSNKENIAEMLLDDLLRTEACKELFTDEDRDLFYYVFTNKGYNIRNDVAHGFYLPHDYTFYKAILVFLCFLRLIHNTN